MATKEQLKALQKKRDAVVNRLNEIDEVGIDLLATLWDEKTLDALILALGIGHVELDER
jgi:hypothetical protein